MQQRFEKKLLDEYVRQCEFVYHLAEELPQKTKSLWRATSDLRQNC